MRVEVTDGTGYPSFLVEQVGDTITGVYKGQFGELPVTGSVSNNDVILRFTATGPNGEVPIDYRGAIDGDSISGRVSMAELGNGTFTGRRVSPPVLNARRFNFRAGVAASTPYRFELGRRPMPFYEQACHVSRRDL